jgi:hypothetical protein
MQQTNGERHDSGRMLLRILAASAARSYASQVKLLSWNDGPTCITALLLAVSDHFPDDWVSSLAP